ncbi:MAG: ferrous iron transport protein B [Gemmatimonadetes bacterium]|nr:ferrous iron transport protein B [Gemmatimonadota bacterium]MBT6146952.1 ferrous iron transport protein B [Gemmatimonadota bacterium]MBT7860324.1 ferrous iron transport protein B [Gemmatimonadota bacterium]
MNERAERQLWEGNDVDDVILLAGNPNTGKSTVFNALTGLRQHTGNWPGKTVARAEGTFDYEGRQYGLIDLPGTYSLLSVSPDEDVARHALLSDEPAVTVVVVDATRLERNLSLALQILSITPRVVICLNLVDEAQRHGVEVNAAALSDQLGVPVIPTAARSGQGLDALRRCIHDVTGDLLLRTPRPLPLASPDLAAARDQLANGLRAILPGLPQADWLALRLLDGDESGLQDLPDGPDREDALATLLLEAAHLRLQTGQSIHDVLSESIYGEAARVADAVVDRPGKRTSHLDARLDALLTSRWTGFPAMFLMLAGVFWLTVEGANVPSGLLMTLLLEIAYPLLKSGAASVGLPWWLDGVLIDGVYLAAAWVIAVMLPPMAIFFPLFTLLEDFGYLPRVAFNLDHIFRRVGAHGKQALTLSMGFGCNAAGVIACRIIDSPRERLIAILTNNFSLCNGRWPTQILVASIFLGVMAPAMAGVVAAAAVVSVAVLGMLLTLAASWMLSRTVLQGEPSAFHLELPPYRPPQIWRTLHTSFIDRTLFVLWRAIVFAGPAGALIWGVANVSWSDQTLAAWLIGGLDPVGLFLGLNGIILLAYLIAIPANEIVIPTILMLIALMTGTGTDAGTGVMFEFDSLQDTGELLRAGGFTTMTAVCIMLFSLAHNPCSTTLYTIYRETGSVRWTLASTIMPLVVGVLLCVSVRILWTWLG